jgi:hypothetical protein
MMKPTVDWYLDRVLPPPVVGVLAVFLAGVGMYLLAPSS